MVVEERARRPSRSGQGAELGITHRALARLVEGTAHPRRREIAGLGAKPDEHTLRRVEGDLDAHSVHLGALGLLHAVAGNVRRVVEPGQERPVLGHEDLDLAYAGLGPQEGETVTRGARKLGESGH